MHESATRPYLNHYTLTLLDNIAAFPTWPTPPTKWTTTPPLLATIKPRPGRRPATMTTSTTTSTANGGHASDNQRTHNPTLGGDDDNMAEWRQHGQQYNSPLHIDDIRKWWQCKHIQNPYTITPVSYTHLDVYKRHMVCCTLV